MDSKKERLGLGLSGGGFRASFFHIGLLAQMAEQGMLRHVEVISTVSGGSIVGALYYLHIKNLLESTADDDIEDQHYVEIVNTIEQDFLKATEKNIRMSTFASFKANLGMVLAHHSRSDRIAELYNDGLYQTVLSGVKTPIQMQELKIFPKGDPNASHFNPDDHNHTRKAKVPILVLNATSLNTGRLWQFTARTMGEPPLSSQDDSRNRIDKKPIRLRRADNNGYDNMLVEPINQQEFPLAHAVAASACVPVLFDPMAVSNLYFNKQDNESIRVQLVDGGVVDNQGIEGLLRYDCTSFIISDACGQMGTKNNPSVDAISVASRVNSILQDGVRTEGLLHLIDNSQNKGNVAFISLRDGLGVNQIGWFDKSNNQVADVPIAPTSQDFGVDPAVQDSLSKMRTDLDAFTEVEAYSLMLDAYLMSKHELSHFKKSVAHQGINNSPLLDGFSWRFLDIGKWLKNPTDHYRKQLDVAQFTFGKTIILLPWLWLPLGVVILGLLYLLWPQIIAVLSGSIAVSVIVVAVALWLVNKFADSLLSLLPIKLSNFLEWLRPNAVMAKAVGKFALTSMGTLFVKLYLWKINDLFVEYGRLNNLK